MRIYRHFLFAVVTLTAQVGLSVCPHTPVARAAALPADQIATYRSKLDQAEASRGLLSRQAGCLGDYVADLQARTADRERALGDARSREQKLTAQMSSAEEALRGFQKQAMEETEKFVSKKREYEEVRNEQEKQASRLEDCKKYMTFLSSLCKPGEYVVKKLGMRDAEAELRDAEARLRFAQDGLREAQVRLDESRKALSQAQLDFAVNQNSIVEMEKLISQAKAANADLNLKVQAFAIRLDAFANALKEAGDLDLGDVRLRQIDRLSSDLESLTSETPAFIASTEAGLPNDAKAKCSR